MRFFAFFLTAALLSGADPTPVQPSQNIQLFSGGDTRHWYTFLQRNLYEDPLRVFSIQDGMLRISGEEWGGITTRDAFRDYYLRVEWKWGGKAFGNRADKARDSGILLHGTGPDRHKREFWQQSVEYQLIEGGTGDYILVDGYQRVSGTAEVREEPNGQIYWQKGGKKVTTDSKRINWYGRDPEWKDVLGFRGKQDVENPVGEWNVSEMLCDGDTITAILNGKVVNYVTNLSQSAGKITIQSEGAEILIRKVEIGPISPALRQKYRP
jgi:hypothetical protein